MESNKQINFVRKKDCKEYKDILRQENVTKIIKNQNLQESYTIWSYAVEYAIQKVSKIKPRLNPRRDIKELMKMRKIMRKKLETTKDQTEKKHLKDRIKIIRAYNRQEKRK